jgi:succinate dehydrogenase / fumarate reductase cytochrome b subunit
MFSWIGRFLSSSIGKKTTMAVTGLLLVGFLVMHLAGNLLLYAGDGAFDGYAQKLHDLGPLLYVAEAGLVLLFVLHINFAVRTLLENRRATPSKYAVAADRGGKTLASSTMPLTGVIVLLFLFWHIVDFRLDGGFKGLFTAENRGAGAGELVWERLGSTAHVAVYLLGIAALTLHLTHAIRSAFQTLGLRHPRWTPIIDRGSLVVAFALGLGFASIPFAAAIR